MPTEEKAQEVKEIQERLGRSTIAVSTQFRGATVRQMVGLRNKLREAGIEYLVVKNTLAGIAADNCGKSGLRQVIQGPTAIAFGYGDVVTGPKVLLEHIRATGSPVTLTGAYTAGQVLDRAEVQALATMPPRPVLMGRLMGGILGPVYGLASALNYHIAAMARALEARRKQLEASQG